MATYNWQLNDWPNFQFSTKSIEDELLLFSEKVGRVTGILKALPDDARMEAVIDIILAEALKTSAIEGEFPSRRDVQHLLEIGAFRLLGKAGGRSTGYEINI